VTPSLFSAPTSENNRRLQQTLQQYPAADANHDGILTVAEARAYRDQKKQGTSGEGDIGRPGRAFGPTTVSGEASTGGEVKGRYGLYMGHSFFKPAALGLLDVIPDTKIIDHTGCFVFAGGQNGSPKILWGNSTSKEAGQKFLQSGKIELLVMTCYADRGGSIDEYSSVEHYSQWFDDALLHNPKVEFMIALPWEKFQSKATEKDLGEKEENVTLFYEHIIQKLRKKYPKNKIIFCPYGLGVYELVRRFHRGELPGVKSMVNPKTKANDQLFLDRQGHGGALISHLNTLVWLQTIYNYDIADLKPQRVEGLPNIDLNEIAAKVYNKVVPFNKGVW
jgi:hypothetical protein